MNRCRHRLSTLVKGSRLFVLLFQLFLLLLKVDFKTFSRATNQSLRPTSTALCSGLSGPPCAFLLADDRLLLFKLLLAFSQSLHVKRVDFLWRASLLIPLIRCQCLIQDLRLDRFLSRHLYDIHINFILQWHSTFLYVWITLHVQCAILFISFLLSNSLSLTESRGLFGVKSRELTKSTIGQLFTRRSCTICRLRCDRSPYPDSFFAIFGRSLCSLDYTLSLQSLVQGRLTHTLFRLSQKSRYSHLVLLCHHSLLFGG